MTRTKEKTQWIKKQDKKHSTRTRAKNAGRENIKKHDKSTSPKATKTSSLSSTNNRNRTIMPHKQDVEFQQCWSEIASSKIRATLSFMFQNCISKILNDVEFQWHSEIALTSIWAWRWIATKLSDFQGQEETKIREQHERMRFSHNNCPFYIFCNASTRSGQVTIDFLQECVDCVVCVITSDTMLMQSHVTRRHKKPIVTFPVTNIDLNHLLCIDFA